MLVASVMLTCNLWQEVGMCNGAIGVVEDLLFHHDRLPPCLPIPALVEFANYTVPVFLATNPNTLPLPLHLFEWETDGQRLNRQQLPLRLRYAMTINKSQGQTLPQVVVDLRQEICSLQNVVLQPISFQRLESIGKSKRLQERLQEERRLRNLAEVTAVRYQHL